MIWYNNSACACFFCFKRTLYSHNPLYNKWGSGHLYDIAKLWNCFASGWRIKCAWFMYQLHLLTDGLNVPWLYGRYSGTLCIFDSLGGCNHDIWVSSVTCESCNAVLCTGWHEDIVVCHIIQTVSVVQLYCTYRTCKYRIFKSTAEEWERGVYRLILGNSIHVYTDLFPFVGVAYGCVADTLWAGTGHLVFACAAVAFRTGLAVFSKTWSGIFDTFCIVHIFPPSVNLFKFYYWDYNTIIF